MTMASNRELQLVEKIRQLLPDSKKKYTWADIEKVHRRSTIPDTFSFH